MDMTTAAGTGGVGQDDVACAGGHLIDQVLVQFAGRDQLTGDGLRAAEGHPRWYGSLDCLSAVVGLVSNPADA